MVAMSVRRWFAAPAVLLTCLGAGPAVGAQQPARSEYEVKAAYLYTFGRFVEWPAGRAGAEFAVCVLGVDPFGPLLDVTLAGTAVRGTKVVARRVSALTDAAGCHILFVSA